MIIKKFVGKTEEEALEAAKKELGNGVVTMNVRTVKKKGLAGFFGARQTEVTVALEEEKESLKAVRRTLPPKQETALPESGARADAETGAVRNANSLMTESSRNIEKKLDSLQTLLVNRLQQEESAKNELTERREESEPGEEPAGAAVQEPSEQEKFIRLLYNTMLENEVDEKYVNQILDEADKPEKPDVPIDFILANIYQKMILKFGKARGILPAEKGPRVVLFMGPTGVGKTTTIAKIASRFAVDEKKKVALLTADTYRIAAAEQLRTYANILEVPFRVVYSGEEASEAIADLSGFDYIFVDTAGHSHQNTEKLDDMKQMIQAVARNAEYQVFLVLSAATKYRDLLRIASSYREFTDYQLIFTKLDETGAFGNLMNVKLYMDTPIAFVTYGQNVPDDIELFNPQKTVKQLLSTRH